MVALRWENKFSVGIEEIDGQHKQLFNLINEIRDAIKAGQSREILSNCVQKLDDYTSYHFNLEEKFMADNHFPHLEEHKLLHKEFIQAINDFKINLDPEKHISAYNILEFLINWIAFHILESDKEYAYYIVGHKK